MSGLVTRTHIAHLDQHYLCPLVLPGETGQDLPQWIAAAGTPDHPLEAVYSEDDQGERRLRAEGYAFERTVTAALADGEHAWTERVLVVRSAHYRQVQQAGLEKRLQRATARLLALTPAPGRGKRQIQDENALVAAADAILQAEAVTGLRTYTFARQEPRQTKYVGRGRGGPTARNARS